MELNLDTEEGEEEMDLDFDLGSEEGEEEGDMDLDLDLGSEEGTEDLDLDLGDESEGMDLDLGGEEEMEVKDLTNVNDQSQLISVFKKMGPEDEIEVVNDNGLVTLKDNKSGSEYRIELNSAGDVANVEAAELEESFKNYNGIIYEVVVDDDMEDEMSDYMEDEMSDYMEDEMSYMNYKKSGLKHPEKADLNKDRDISSYEKKRGMAIEKSMDGEEDHEDEDDHKRGPGHGKGGCGNHGDKDGNRLVLVINTLASVSE
jgi:hypothetical protein